MKKLIRPTAEEDAAITKAAMADPDSIPFTDEEWEAVKHTVVRGRNKLSDQKVNTLNNFPNLALGGD
jgi:glucokinase